MSQRLPGQRASARLRLRTLLMTIKGHKRSVPLRTGFTDGPSGLKVSAVMILVILMMTFLSNDVTTQPNIPFNVSGRLFKGCNGAFGPRTNDPPLTQPF